jgi:hypothetical protein
MNRKIKMSAGWLRWPGCLMQKLAAAGAGRSAFRGRVLPRPRRSRISLQASAAGGDDRPSTSSAASSYRRLDLPQLRRLGSCLLPVINAIFEFKAERPERRT